MAIPWSYIFKRSLSKKVRSAFTRVGAGRFANNWPTVSSLNGVISMVLIGAGISGRAPLI